MCKCRRKNLKSNKGFCLLAKNSSYQYRKNRKSNKSNEIQDFEKEQAKKGLEKCANVAKI